MSATYGKYYLILLSLGLFANCSPIPVCHSNAECGVGAQCVNGTCEGLPLQPMTVGLPDSNNGSETTSGEPAAPAKQSVIVTDPEARISAERLPTTPPAKQSVTVTDPETRISAEHVPSGVEKAPSSEPCVGAACQNNPSDPTTCQNGIVEFGEQCDDGNNTNNDYCSVDCQTAHAFPSALGSPGACTDGQDNDGDGNIDSADPACDDPAWPSEAKVYVAIDGADNASRSGEASQPWRTIQFALANRRSATTVLVKPGTYFECLSLSSSARHVRIKGLGAAILDGSRCSQPIVTIEDSLEPSTILSDLTLTNSTVGAVKLLGTATLLRLNITSNRSQNGGSAISEGQNGHGVIRSCSIINNEDAFSSPVYLGSKIDPFIESSIFASNKMHSNVGVITALGRIIFRHNQVIDNINEATQIATYGAGLSLFSDASAETAVVFNNLFARNHASGYSDGGALYVHQSAIIANNTFVDNVSWHAPAMWFYVDLGEVTVRHNVVANNKTVTIPNTFQGDRQAIYSGGHSVTIDYNLFWNNSVGDVGGEFTLGAHNITNQDPLLRPDHQLSSQSPAVDAGSDTAVFWGLGAYDQSIVDLGYHPIN